MDVVDVYGNLAEGFIDGVDANGHRFCGVHYNVELHGFTGRLYGQFDLTNAPVGNRVDDWYVGVDDLDDDDDWDDDEGYLDGDDEYDWGPLRVPFVFGDEQVTITVDALFPNGGYINEMQNDVMNALSQAGFNSLDTPGISLSDPRVFPAITVAVNALTSPEVTVYDVTVRDATGVEIDHPVKRLIMPARTVDPAALSILRA